MEIAETRSSTARSFTGKFLRHSFSLLFAAGVVVGLAGESSAQTRRLTTDGRLKSSPVFSDSTGSELLFVVQERPTQLRMMRLKLEDLSVTPVDEAQTKSEFEPAISPDGKFLAFVQSRGNLSLALVIRDRRTGKIADIPPAGGFSGPRSPAFSADGRRVLFSHPDEGRQSIVSVNLDAGDRKILIDSQGVNNWPDCAPDGKKMVWASTRDDDYELYAASVDGTDVRRLTFSPKMDIRPRFSPDGSQIVFTSNRDGNYEIYRMNADGNDVRRMTDHPESDDYPVWRPGGRHVVMVSERDGQHDLYLVEIPPSR